MSVTMYPANPQNWTFDGNPNNTVINLGQGGTLFLFDRAVDTTTGYFWECINVGVLDIDAQTINGSVWIRITPITKVGTTRSYNSESISFGVPRQPNLTNDTFVVLTIQISLTILQSSNIDVQIDSGNGFSTIATLSMSGVVIAKNDVLSFIVPAGSSYKLMSSGNGTNTIIDNFELTL